MFENAKWITKQSLTKPWSDWTFPRHNDLIPSPYLAKTFSLGKPIKKAHLHAVGYGQAVYFLNGERIPDCYLPTQPTDPALTVVYNTYDITNLLKQGNNRFGILLGNYDYHHKGAHRSCMRAIAQIDIEYDDGTAEQICTNSSFRAATSPIIFTCKLFGENYDARLETEGWCDADFDDSGWENAIICSPPGGSYRENLCPPIRIIREVEGKEIAPKVFDFGTNTSGWVRIAVKGKEGSEIKILYSERLQSDGQSVNREGLARWGSHTDIYILSDKKEAQIWEQSTSYHGFRYVQIDGEYDEISVKAIVAFTDMPTVSSFWCDNEIVNCIHRASINSIQTNCHGVMTDCPHREQNPWTGDACASAQAVNLNFDAYDMFYEWMHHFRDNQTPEGRLCSLVPSLEDWPYNNAVGVDWDSAMIHIPYYTFKYSGDRRIVDLVWDNMCKSLSYFESQCENYLNHFVVGDWKGEEELHHERCNGAFVGSTFFHWDTLMVAEMARETGRDDTPFVELAARIKASYRSEYIKDGVLQSDYETAIALTACAGIYEKDEEEAEIARMEKMIRERGYRLSIGVWGARTVFEMLSRYGYDETVFRCLTNLDAPGYASVYRAGLDTLPEDFDFYDKLPLFDNNTLNPADIPSLNHQYYSSIEAWFYQSLLGIKIEGVGYSNVIIEPKFVSGIHEVKGNCRGICVSYDDKAVEIDCPYPFIYRYKEQEKSCLAGKYTFER